MKTTSSLNIFRRINWVAVILFGCLFSPNLLSAQQVISSLGFAGNEFSMTIGEPVITTVQNGSFILTQGMLQTDTTKIVSVVESLEMTVSYRVYPNPTGNQLFVEIQSPIPLTLDLDLLDMSGRLCRSWKGMDMQSGQAAELSLQGLMNGIYLLHFLSRKQTMKTIRIEKR